MKIIISTFVLLIVSVLTYIYTWDIPVPEKEVMIEINILDLKK